MTTGISIDTYNHMQAKLMTEDQLQKVITAVAQRMGFLVYHTHDSRRSEPGYPDLHLVHGKKGISLFRELKTMKGRVSPDQVNWLAALKGASVDAGIWRPLDWFDGSIEKQLRGEKKPVRGGIGIEGAGIGSSSINVPAAGCPITPALDPWQIPAGTLRRRPRDGHTFHP